MAWHRTVCIKIGWKWKRKRSQRPIRSFHWLIAVQYMPFSRQWNVYAASTLFTLVHARQIFARRWQCWLFDSVWILRKIYVCMPLPYCLYDTLNLIHLAKAKVAISIWTVHFVSSQHQSFLLMCSIAYAVEWFFSNSFSLSFRARYAHYASLAFQEIRHVYCPLSQNTREVFFYCHEFITEHMQSCSDVIMTRKSIKLLRTWQEQMVEYIWQIFRNWSLSLLRCRKEQVKKILCSMLISISIDLRFNKFLYGSIDGSSAVQNELFQK